MTEQEYINTKALGTITAAINTLKDLCAENLKDTIKDGESKKVLGTLYDWQDWAKVGRRASSKSSYL